MWDTVSIESIEVPDRSGTILKGAILFSCVMPARTTQETEAAFIENTREIASWILRNKNQFSPGDRFGIILAWPTSIRKTARQIIKTFGDFDFLTGITDGTTPVLLRDGWADGIFESL